MKKGKKTIPVIEMNRSRNNREGSLSPVSRGGSEMDLASAACINDGKVKSAINGLEVVGSDYLRERSRRHSAEKCIKSMCKNINNSMDDRLTAKTGTGALLLPDASLDSVA